MPTRQLILRVWLIGVVAFFAVSAAAQQSNATVRLLSLADCIQMGLQHNLNIQIAQLSPALARYTLKASRGIYDPVLTLSANKNFVDQPFQFDPKKPGIDTEYELEVDSVGPSLAGRLPFGLNYSLSSISYYEHSKSFFDISNNPTTFFAFPPFGIRFTNDWFQATGITLSQPLLKDFWIDVYRRDIQVNKKLLKVSELTLRGLLITNVAQIETAYYDLLLAREQVKVQGKSLQVATQLVQNITRQVKAGTLTDLDLQNAQSSAETAQSGLAGAAGAYARQKNLLKNLLTDNIQDWFRTDIEASENLIALHEPANFQDSWLKALSGRTDLLAMAVDLEIDDINLRYLYNQLFPSLNLTGSYGWLEVERTFSGSLHSLREGANAYYSAGVTLSFPLFNTTARANYKGGKLLKQQSLLRLTQLEKDVVTDVDNAVKIVDATFSQVTATRLARTYAEAALNAQVKQFETGTTNSFIVLEFQRNLTAARSAEIVALADYNKAKAQLSVSEGTTLEKHKINVKVH